MRFRRGLAVALASGALGTVALSAPVAAADTVIVTPTNQQGWSEADTRPPGDVEFVADTGTGGNGALELRTVSADPVSAVAAKAQYLHAADTPLADVTELSYWTKQVAATFAEAAASYQLIVCLSGEPTATTCPGFTTFVFEPYQNPAQGPVVAEIWQSWDVDAGLFWSTRTVDCDGDATPDILGTPGGPATYTLGSILAECPDAVVGGFGVNIGTNNPNWVVRTDLFNFNGTTYDFELSHEPEDKDDCKRGGWMTRTRDDGSTFRNQGDCIRYVNTGR